jgi:RluA family pseudouridine synthase
MIIPVIHQDESVLVVNKPAGIPVLPDGWEKDAPYLVKILEQQFGRIWVVHRLDKVTSGVIIFARTQEAHRTLNIQFEQHDIQKLYRAILVGEPKWNEYTARHRLRIDVGRSHRTVVDQKVGKSSVTRFVVLERFIGFTLVDAFPVTGRTHQIRVHACALGYPLLGENLYNSPRTELITRPALHSQEIIIKHPATGESLTFSAPQPQDFQLAIDCLIVR